MKYFVFFLAIVLLVAGSFSSCLFFKAPVEEQPYADTITYQQFYDQLGPYGRWIDYPGFGFVWAPAIPDFKPYYSGRHWVYTDFGWTWVSDYPWGWATFHYGRWFYETGYGWLWVPGYEWAPAWVCWRSSVDYYGWAPLAPGMSVTFSVGINIPYEHWVFVPHPYIGDPHFHSHCMQESFNDEALKVSHYVNEHQYTKNKTMYASGPGWQEIRKYVVQSKPLPVHGATIPGQTSQNDGSVRIFRPPVKPVEGKTNPGQPKQTTPFKDIPHDNGKRGTWSAPRQDKGSGDLKQKTRRF